MVFSGYDGDGHAIYVPYDIPTLVLASAVHDDLDRFPLEFEGEWKITRATGAARLETWTLECVNTAGTDWTVYSSITQPAPKETDPDQDPWPHATTDDWYTSIGGEVTFAIDGGSKPFAKGDRFTFTTTGVTHVSAAVTIVDGQISEGPIAVIDAEPLSAGRRTRSPLTGAVRGNPRVSLSPSGGTSVTGPLR